MQDILPQLIAGARRQYVRCSVASPPDLFDPNRGGAATLVAKRRAHADLVTYMKSLGIHSRNAGPCWIVAFASASGCQCSTSR